jgi:acid phosphatase (class A)
MCVILSGCTSVSPPPAAAVTPVNKPSRYLDSQMLPDSKILLPHHPAQGSAAMALDEEISQRSFALRDTPRWALARVDTDVSFPKAAGTFSCALNAPVTEADTPRLYQLLLRTRDDLGYATRSAKKHSQRPRPFVSNQAPICTPEHQAQLSKDSSYPSGHATVGWGWALILAELSPSQAQTVLARGLAYGESRNVCNVHWHSDVVQARSVAAAMVAALHSNADFRADMDAARAELLAVRSRGLSPTRDCVDESAALAQVPSLAQ